MASDLSTPGWERVGDVDVRSSFGDPAKSLGVWRRRSDGAVNLDVRYAGVILTPAGRDKLRELLDRAAMPWQEELPRAAKCPRCGLPGGTAPASPAKACQHIWHQYRPQAEAEQAAMPGQPGAAGEAEAGRG